jgi:hypothetical protein
MDMWDAIRIERLDLVERLSGLADHQWEAASLCDKWRIRDVLAHVTAGAEGAYGMGTTLSGMLRHGFSLVAHVVKATRPQPWSVSVMLRAAPRSPRGPRR